MHIITATFHGASLYGVDRPDGVYVALKPIVAAIGLDWSAQLQRVKRDAILSEGVVIMPTPFGHGGDQETACLRLDVLIGWLFGISAGSVKDEKKRASVYATLGDGELPPHMLDADAPTGGAQKFPEAASFRISLSRVRPATALRSRVFSVSRSFSRLTRSDFRPPNSWRQR